MIRVGVVGYGYWGPNVLRNFNMHPHSQVVALADPSDRALESAHGAYPHLKLYKDYKELIQSPDVDVVAVVTPVQTHFEITKDILLNGKHAFVEKPFTQTSQQAEELVELAQQKNLVLMVDHTFLFTEPVRKMKELIDNHQLGKLLYFDATRVNLGLFRSDVNVIWDLAPHDFSIMEYLIPYKPISLSALGMDHFNTGLYNTAYVTIYFDQMIAHFNLNWLSPVKIRSTYVGGDHRMVAWDDLSSDEKLKIYDKGVMMETNQTEIYRKKVAYRLGDVLSPQLGSREALNREAEYFLECVNQNKTPFNDGKFGLKIVKLLEATDKSIANQGRMVNL